MTALTDKEFIDLLTSNSETKVRIGIKTIEEIVIDDSKKRKVNAPLSIEEKALLHM